MITIRLFLLFSLLVLFGFNRSDKVMMQPVQQLALPTFAVHRFTFPANTPGSVLKTNVVINKFDFVCFSAYKRVKLGMTVPVSDAGGVLAPHLVNTYNHISDPAKIIHGRLFCGNVNEWVPASTLDAMKFGATLLTTLCSDRDTKFDTIRANGFVAKDRMNLSFLLNDKQPQDNRGSFAIEVVVVPYEVHRTRNRYNRCPLYEPVRGTEVIKDCPENGLKSVDYKGNRWIYNEKEEYFHGDTNNTYRGANADLYGCQCTYSQRDGRLVVDGNLGTFDFALVKYRQTNLLNKDLTTWQHIVLDIWPHEAFKRFAASTGRAFVYEPTPQQNIYYK